MPNKNDSLNIRLKLSVDERAIETTRKQLEKRAELIGTSISAELNKELQKSNIGDQLKIDKASIEQSKRRIQELGNQIRSELPERFRLNRALEEMALQATEGKVDVDRLRLAFEGLDAADDDILKLAASLEKVSAEAKQAAADVQQTAQAAKGAGQAAGQVGPDARSFSAFGEFGRVGTSALPFLFASQRFGGTAAIEGVLLGAATLEVADSLGRVKIAMGELREQSKNLASVLGFSGIGLGVGVASLIALFAVLNKRFKDTAEQVRKTADAFESVIETQLTGTQEDIESRKEELRTQIQVAERQREFYQGFLKEVDQGFKELIGIPVLDDLAAQGINLGQTLGVAGAETKVFEDRLKDATQRANDLGLQLELLESGFSEGEAAAQAVERAERELADLRSEAYLKESERVRDLIGKIRDAAESGDRQAFDNAVEQLSSFREDLVDDLDLLETQLVAKESEINEAIKGIFDEAVSDPSVVDEGVSSLTEQFKEIFGKVGGKSVSDIQAELDDINRLIEEDPEEAEAAIADFINRRAEAIDRAFDGQIPDALQSRASDVGEDIQILTNNFRLISEGLRGLGDADLNEELDNIENLTNTDPNLAVDAIGAFVESRAELIDKEFGEQTASRLFDSVGDVNQDVGNLVDNFRLISDQIEGLGNQDISLDDVPVIDLIRELENIEDIFEEDPEEGSRLFREFIEDRQGAIDEAIERGLADSFGAFDISTDTPEVQELETTADELKNNIKEIEIALGEFGGVASDLGLDNIIIDSEAVLRYFELLAEAQAELVEQTQRTVEETRRRVEVEQFAREATVEETDARITGLENEQEALQATIDALNELPLAARQTDEFKEAIAEARGELAGISTELDIIADNLPQIIRRGFDQLEEEIANLREESRQKIIEIDKKLAQDEEDLREDLAEKLADIDDKRYEKIKELEEKSFKDVTKARNKAADDILELEEKINKQRIKIIRKFNQDYLNAIGDRDALRAFQLKQQKEEELKELEEKRAEQLKAILEGRDDQIRLIQQKLKEQRIEIRKSYDDQREDARRAYTRRLQDAREAAFRAREQERNRLQEEIRLRQNAFQQQLGQLAGFSNAAISSLTRFNTVGRSQIDQFVNYALSRLSRTTSTRVSSGTYNYSNPSPTFPTSPFTGGVQSSVNPSIRQYQNFNSLQFNLATRAQLLAITDSVTRGLF